METIQVQSSIDTYISMEVDSVSFFIFCFLSLQMIGTQYNNSTFQNFSIF